MPAQPVLRVDRHRQEGKYLDTREVADQARLLMAQRGWQVALLLAHGHHVPRALRICTRLGIPLKHHDPGSDAEACARIVIAARSGFHMATTNPANR